MPELPLKQHSSLTLLDGKGNTMTKKLLKALANAIADIQDVNERISITNSIGQVCENRNNRFDWVLWLKACGVYRAD